MGYPQDTHEDEQRLWIPVKPRPGGNPNTIRKRGNRRWVAPPDWVVAYKRRIRLHLVGLWRGPAHQGPVDMDVTFTFRPPESWGLGRIRDALTGRAFPDTASFGDRDNLEKLLMDAFKGVVFVDDSQVVGGHVRKRFGLQAGYRLAVRPAEHEDQGTR